MQPRNSSRNPDTRRCSARLHAGTHPATDGLPLRPANATAIQPAPVDAQPIIASLSQREKDFLVIYLKEGVLGVSDVVKLTGAAQSSCITR